MTPLLLLYTRYFIGIIITIYILDFTHISAIDSCFIGSEFSPGNVTLTEGDKNRTWLNRQRPLPTGRVTAYSLKTKRVTPSADAEHGVRLLIWRPLTDNRVILIWQKLIKIFNAEEVQIKEPLIDEHVLVEEGDFYGWTAHGDIEITVQYMHGNVCYQLVYDENQLNSAVDVTKENQINTYNTAICFPAEFDLGVFVDTDTCQRFGKTDQFMRSASDTKNETKLGDAVGGAGSHFLKHNILIRNCVMLCIVFVISRHNAS